jgi:hypothetical protein
LEIPPQYQLLSALVIGVLVAIGAAYRFFAELRRRPEAGVGGQMRILGIASGDAASLSEIVDQLREIRGVMQRRLDTDRSDQLVKAIDRVADAVTHREPLPPAPRPRTRARRPRPGP